MYGRFSDAVFVEMRNASGPKFSLHLTAGNITMYTIIPLLLSLCYCMSVTLILFVCILNSYSAVDATWLGLGLAWLGLAWLGLAWLDLT